MSRFDDYSKYNYSDMYTPVSKTGRKDAKRAGGKETWEAAEPARRKTEAEYYPADYSGQYSKPVKENVPSTKKRARAPGKSAGWPMLIFLVAVTAALAATVLPEVKSRPAQSEIPLYSPQIAETAEPEISTDWQNSEENGESETDVTEAVTETLPPEPVDYDFNPHSVEGTEPENLIDRVRIMVNDVELQDITTYENKYGEITFASGDEYTSLDGILTFRGNNYRDTASWGVTKTLTSKKLSKGWEVTTTVLTDYWGNQWSGNGWTGQSLVVRWPKSTRAVMTSMNSWAREQEDLVEVITASMDGKVYFTELSTGKATRNALNMGITYKGGGALDPRGYPILYLGGGVKNMDNKCNVSVVNLLDCSVMYSFGNFDNFASRAWPNFDSSPLVDAETDQLIYPAENGLLYIIHLNTQYDEQAGTLSVNPDNTVKWRYHNKRSDESQTAAPFWGGFESSVAIYKGYAFLTENGGAMMCLDLNSLQLVWVQDVLDDSNCSPVIDIEADGHPYVYVSTSFHYGWRSTGTAKVPIWKIDAETGEIIWQVDYTCQTESGVSGGVEGTLAIDDTSVYVPFAKVQDPLKGVLVSIDKKTGEKNWERPTNIYSWASPIRFDDESGNKYILYNNGYGGQGYLYLINAETGEIIDSMNLNGVAEASGAVFENWLVLPTRSCRIFGIKLS